MTVTEKAKVITELGWLHEDPQRVMEAMTEEQLREVIRLGYITNHLWAEIKEKLEHTCSPA